MVMGMTVEGAATARLFRNAFAKPPVSRASR
jgi:hypothetical protein